MDTFISSPFFSHQAQNPAALRYGTAGFRMTAELMPPIALRLGPVFAERANELLSQQQQNQQQKQNPLYFGVMITASHNAIADNGLKIVEPPHAHMLCASGEARATQLARTATREEFQSVLDEMNLNFSSSSASSENENNNNNNNNQNNFIVIIGVDTRPSCVPIRAALKEGIEAFGGRVHFLPEQCTTPMLHWSVEIANSSNNNASAQAITTRLTNENYLKTLVEKFVAAVSNSNSLRLRKQNSQQQEHEALYTRHLIIDCANGVGSSFAVNLERLLTTNEQLKRIVNYTFELVNCTPENLAGLNDRCGADFVQKQQLLPVQGTLTADNFSTRVRRDQQQDESSTLFYSLDGDADRVVAGTMNVETNRPIIFEGDRFTALFATILGGGGAGEEQQQQAAAGGGAVASSTSQQENQQEQDQQQLSIGAVQTAYANGASTNYLRSRGSNSNLQVEFALTGVKHVHAAAERYDIGLYFESNGHGTVLVKQEKIQQENQNQNQISQAALAICQMCSQSCGDAFANLLATEFALLELGWLDPRQWLALYDDLPCVQTKVPVADPAVFRCEQGNEQRLVAPAGMQEQVDAAVAEANQNQNLGNNNNKVRAFVRPSGTEPVVRLYVEAVSLEVAQALTDKLKRIVENV